MARNLFSAADANGGEPWQVDRAVVRLMDAGVTEGAIIVGAWCGPERWRDYMPQVALPPAVTARFASYANGPVHSDRYLAFLTGVVKPLVDATYRTRPEQQSTSVMGSSMGGLISLYALERYPATFGAAGCVSTHWSAGDDALVDALAALLPPAGQHRLYFDYGTVGLDAAYEPFQLRMDKYLAAAGYTRGVDWLTEEFVGADHNEVAWRARVDLPLQLLLRTAEPQNRRTANRQA